MKAAVYILRFILGFIYFFMKLLPTDKNKVLFLSRQSDEPTEDFLALAARLREVKPDIKLVMITKRADKGIKNLIVFGWQTLRSMHHLATSSVCVLDTYWPAVSMLKHKPSLCVIQLWHAMAKIKKSGWQTVGKKLGRSQKLALAANMHGGYDVVIAGGKAFNPFYCASFGVTEDVLYNVGLPRMDMLRENVGKCEELFFSKYPELRGKKLVLYAPTFRRGQILKPDELVNAFEPYADTVLIIKRHPNQRLSLPEGKTVYTCDEVPTSCVLSVCDCVISDYSAISIEAAVLNKPLYFYLFDYEEYLRDNGLNVVLSDELPDCVFCEAAPLAECVISGEYDTDAYRRFREKYLPEQSCRATDRIAELITDCLKRGKHEAISERVGAQNRTDRDMGGQDTVRA